MIYCFYILITTKQSSVVNWSLSRKCIVCETFNSLKTLNNQFMLRKENGKIIYSVPKSWLIHIYFNIKSEKFQINFSV